MRNKIDQKSLALSLGIVWGLFLGFLGIIANFGFAVRLVDILGDYYIGFSPNIIGIFAGLVGGFICGAIGGYIIAWLYNKFSKT